MKIKYYNVALGIVLTALTMTSCSNDDGDSPEAPKVKMALSSMRGGYVGESLQFSITDIKYDANGRVTGYTYNNNIGYTYTNNKVTYTYSDTKIVKRTEYYSDVEENYSEEEENYSEEEYVVKDGLIISNESTTYSYDGNNQLVKIGGNGWSASYTWENGNPTAMTEKEDGYSAKSTFEYSNESNVLSGNFQDETFSTVYMNCEPFLCAAGYFGKQPKNLVSKIYVSGKLDRSFTYSSPNAEGYPTKMEIVDDDYDIQEYTLSWVKI